METPETLGKFAVTILDPKVIVFHNVLEDPEALIDFYESKEEWWGGWYGFGSQINKGGPAVEYSAQFPTLEEWEESMILSDTDDLYHNEVAYAYYQASAEYFTYTGTKLDNWTTRGWGLSRYIPDHDIINNSDLTMVYHTDYSYNVHDQPGEKFAVTAVLYPNDDYDSGELSLRVVDEHNNVVSRIEYKPKAGDMVFFPSGRPYYHGVKRIWGAPKYIMRMYWQYSSEGSPEWHALKEKYGDKFQELEDARSRDAKFQVSYPFLRPRFTIDEYYELYEKGYVVDGKLDIENIPEGYGIKQNLDWTS